MSLVNNGRITVKPFAEVPPLGGLPGIFPKGASPSNLLSSEGEERLPMDLSEGCFVTKSVKYTHQLVYWINAADGDPTEVETLLNELRIIPDRDFMLNDACNLAFLEPFVHAALDIYAFIAVTPSKSTLEGLIAMVQADNAERQKRLDENGIDPGRSLDFSHLSFVDPEYEFVVLRPEHFLPVGSVLPIYDPVTQICKLYVPAQDQRLRESTQSSSPRLPAFRHTLANRSSLFHVNVFLVAMNAEIKFRRYFQEIQLNPPTTSLPNDVLDLMMLTLELIDLVYWEAKPTKGSKGESNLAEMLAIRHYYAQYNTGHTEIGFEPET